MKKGSISITNKLGEVVYKKEFNQLPVSMIGGVLMGCAIIGVFEYGKCIKKEIRVEQTICDIKKCITKYGSVVCNSRSTNIYGHDHCFVITRNENDTYDIKDICRTFDGDEEITTRKYWNDLKIRNVAILMDMCNMEISKDFNKD